MPKIKLTNTFANKVTLKENKSKVDYFDTDVIGLMLEVRKSRKTFYYRYSNNSKRTMHKLGSLDTTTADEARRLALKMKKAIATDSLETIFNKKTQTPTLKSFYENHYLPHIKIHSPSWKYNVRTFVYHILPSLGSYRMNIISKLMIIEAHKEMVTKKKLKNGTANKLVVFLRHAYNLALEMKIDGITENPASKIKLFKETNRQRYLSEDESKRLLSAIEKSNNIYLKYIIPFLILTGARRTEVVSARWEDIDLENRVWTIQITKNKKVRKIPISNELYSLIKSIPKKAEFLFPAIRGAGNGYYTGLHKAWSDVRTIAKLDDLRIHDLRHSFASVLINNGCSLYEVQTLLGHSDIKMTQRYAHLTDESLFNAIGHASKLLG